MLSGIPQVAQIGPSLVAKNGTPFCLFTTVPVSIAAGAGELARGTVLSRKEDGTCEVMATGGTPAYVLADPVDASGTEAVAAVAYRSGNFNPDAVTVAEGYTLTAADKDTLRKYDIIFTRVLPE